MSKTVELGRDAVQGQRNNAARPRGVLRKSLIALALLAICALLLVYGKTYMLRGSLSGGTLYWNENEALVFISEATDGARMNFLSYALEPLLETVRGIRAPDARLCSQTFVIQITDKDVRRYETDLYRYADVPYCGYSFAPFENHIYAIQGPQLWKWSGTNFERPTPDDYRGFATATSDPNAALHRWQFDNVDGWSMRTFGQGPPSYQLTLNGQPITITFQGPTWPPRPISLDLIRASQPPQAIWSFDEEPRQVSKAEYERTFR